jgi:hypothetical protein
MEEAKNVKSSYTILRSAFAKLFCVNYVMIQCSSQRKDLGILGKFGDSVLVYLYRTRSFELEGHHR